MGGRREGIGRNSRIQIRRFREVRTVLEEREMSDMTTYVDSNKLIKKRERITMEQLEEERKIWVRR